MKKPSIAIQFGVPLFGTLIVSGVLIWILGNWASNVIALNLKDTLFDNVGSTLTTEIRNFLQQPQRIIQTNAERLSLVEGPVNKTETAKLFLAQLHQHPAVASIEYADASGKSFGVGRNILNVPYIYWESDRSKRSTGEVYELFDGFRIGSDVLSTFVNYDVRERSWYQTAWERTGPSWTEIYPWPTGKIVGLDAIMRVDRGSEPSVVLDSSITLEELRTFMKKIDPNRIMDAYILESDGNIVAGTDIESPVAVTSEEQYERINAAKSDSKQLKDVYELILRNGGLSEMAEKEPQFVSRLSGSYYYKVIHYTDSYGLSWYVIVLVSRAVAFQAIDQSRIAVLGLIVLILGLASLVAYVVTRKTTDPLIQFSKGIRSFAETGTLDKLPEPKSEEMEELTRSFISMSRKISNQVHKLEENEFSIALENEKLLGTLESVGEGVVVIDTKQNIVLLNKFAAKLSGHAVDSSVGESFGKIFRLSEDGITTYKTFDTFAQAMEERKEIVLPDSLVLIDREKNTVPVYCSGAPIINTDDSLFGYVVVLRDVREQRRMDRAKHDILSLASHQLRTPLSAIKWYSELILNTKGEMSKEQYAAVTAIHKSNDRMIDLVNTLLNASQYELGVVDVEAEDINLDTFLLDTVKQFDALIEEKQLTIKKIIVKPLRMFHGDRKILGIIFTNILSNAVKYSKKKGAITVQLKHDMKKLEFEVNDTGIGIAKRDQELIFTKMYRGDEAKQYAPDGNGLGLYIVKSIVESLGGRISFESASGKGSTFYVRLPGGSMVSTKKHSVA